MADNIINLWPYYEGRNELESDVRAMQADDSSPTLLIVIRHARRCACEHSHEIITLDITAKSPGVATWRPGSILDA